MASINIVRSHLLKASTSASTSASTRLLSTTATLHSSNGPWSDPLPTNRPVHRYLIIAEDAAGGGSGSSSSSLARRLSVRPQHLAEAKAGKVSGRIELGGGLLSTDHAELVESGQDPTQALMGSVFVVQAENIEDARHRLEQDVYFSAGVFDPSKIRIFPFLQASLGQTSNATVNSEATSPAAEQEQQGAVPSLSELREKEMGKWKEAAERTLGWLRDGGGRQNLVS
ncbi:unnamed protein product [Sympodiomycopsis kandeliae]